MGYLKVIDLGHVIEVFEMDRAPVNPHLLKKEKLRMILDSPSYLKSIQNLDDELSEEQKTINRENRKEERRSQTIRDARNRCRRIALMNFNETDCFITLTFADNISDITYSDNEFKKFIKRFNYNFNQKIKFLAVREFQRRGAIHYHMLVDWKTPALLNKEDLRSLERTIGTNIWKHGFVKIQPLKQQKNKSNPVDNVGAYLIKYMTKDIFEKRLVNNKLYLCSQKLRRPLVFIQKEASEHLSALSISTQKIVFQNSYPSEYLGTIQYKEYNLNRKN